jgi:hypothetical protein
MIFPVQVLMFVLGVLYVSSQQFARTNIRQVTIFFSYVRL